MSMPLMAGVSGTTHRLVPITDPTGNNMIIHVKPKPGSVPTGASLRPSQIHVLLMPVADGSGFSVIQRYDVPKFGVNLFQQRKF